MATLASVALDDSANNFVRLNQLSVGEIESSIRAINAEEIGAIAKAFVADIMDRLWIDIEVTHTPRHTVEFTPPESNTGTAWACAKIYNPNSRLMKILLPVCVERITGSFSVPSEFVEKGIVFDLLNAEKTGLLDQVGDEDLQKKISEGMHGGSTFYATLKAKAEKTVFFETEHYKDGKWVATHTATLASLVADVAECVI